MGWDLLQTIACLKHELFARFWSDKILSRLIRFCRGFFCTGAGGGGYLVRVCVIFLLAVCQFDKDFGGG